MHLPVYPPPQCNYDSCHVTLARWSIQPSRDIVATAAQILCLVSYAAGYVLTITTPEAVCHTALNSEIMHMPIVADCRSYHRHDIHFHDAAQSQRPKLLACWSTCPMHDLLQWWVLVAKNYVKELERMYKTNMHAGTQEKCRTTIYGQWGSYQQYWIYRTHCYSFMVIYYCEIDVQRSTTSTTLKLTAVRVVQVIIYLTYQPKIRATLETISILRIHGVGQWLTCPSGPQLRLAHTLPFLLTTYVGDHI
jgi:hypothetical protein